MGITDGPWNFYAYGFGEGQRASITYNVAADEEAEHVGYGACRRVIMRLDRYYENGLPDKDEYERSADEEDRLIERLEADGVDCKKVGHMLYHGIRDTVFQVEPAHTAGFARVFAAWQASLPDRDLELVEKEGWSFFDERVRPSPQHRKWIANNLVVIQLLQAGSDARKPHTLDHTIVGGPAALDAIARELSSKGFAPSVSDGHLTFQQELQLNPDEITTWTMRFTALAEHFDASYDGWGALVVR